MRVKGSKYNQCQTIISVAFQSLYEKETNQQIVHKTFQLTWSDAYTRVHNCYVNTHRVHASCQQHIDKLSLRLWA